MVGEALGRGHLNVDYCFGVDLEGFYLRPLGKIDNFYKPILIAHHYFGFELGGVVGVFDFERITELEGYYFTLQPRYLLGLMLPLRLSEIIQMQVGGEFPIPLDQRID